MRRDHTLRFRVSDEELGEIERARAAEDRTMSDFLRVMILRMVRGDTRQTVKAKRRA